MNMQELSKLPGLLKLLVQKVPEEIEAGRAALQSEFDAGLNELKVYVEGRLGDLEQQIESKVEGDASADLDGKVKAALEDMFGSSFDLSALEEAIGKLGNGGKVETGDAGKGDASDASTAETQAPAADDSKKADISSLVASTGSGFSDFSHTISVADTPSMSHDILPPAAVGADDMSTTTVGTAGSQDPAASDLKPAEAPQKVEPATAGKQAADAATAVGDDPVPAAAKAAHAAAVEIGTDPVKAATDAAAAAGAGTVEAARAADNAHAAAAAGQAVATA